MKRLLAIVLSLSLTKLLIQLLGNRHYGFHRDELLHLSVGEHLDWGFMEFPPLIAVFGNLSGLLFGDSLMGMRLFPTFFGIGILILCVFIARDLGGQWRAALLAGISVLAFLPFYRNHTLFQPVVFEQFFWTLLYYFLVKYLATEQSKWLLWAGVATGLGLLTKYTISLGIFAILLSLFFYQKGTIYKEKKLYFAGLLAFFMFLPTLLWQVQHDFPLLKHLVALSGSQLEASGRWEFILGQVMIPPTLVVSLIGGWYLFRTSSYRWMAISALVVFILMWLLKAKSYYFYPVYPVLFAAGAVQFDLWMRKKKPVWTAVLAASMFLPFIPFIPEVTPVLPITSYIDYKGLEPEQGRYDLTSDYADMFGWEEQVVVVDSIYQSFPESLQNKCVIWAENYGEAGAIKILGDRYGLPDPICRHGSFWMWGPGQSDAEVWISLGNEAEAVREVFSEVQLVRKLYHPYAVEEENGIPVYICQNPKVDIEQWWKDYESHIFD